ncbi:hypothetical protein [Paenibacillus kobensis]|uniref:hypothetical protein n=1 Tax=Paenibacillus kobensis TaxID=59841 RepID=UPI000FD866C3|nr:hypothetical protein [Paenibacillus kobensis]
MAEKSIFAYFHTPNEAERAVERLKSLRLIDYGIERIDGQAGPGYESLDKLGSTVTADFVGLGRLTLGGDFDDPDAGILNAASVSASGYSSGGPDNRVTGRDIMLVAIVAEEDYERGEQIVREEGAL